MCKSLVNKYNVAGPRYTSYPTVPYWNLDTFSLDSWKSSLRQSFAESNYSEGLSIYIHLPFCESLCTFCGCHKRITKRHDLELPYIKALLKEWSLYRKVLGAKPKIKELHIGGGTPTFFSEANLKFLIEELLITSDLADDYEFSFEGHPNNTTEAHLQALYNLGFKRVSFGVQDYNIKVQKAINRIQPFKNVKKVTELARKIGYTSVGHDIIFGLPFQTKEDVIQTIKHTEALLPDRIAFYSYAHVPWIKGNGQRGFRDEDLPSGTSKRQQYQTGKKLLEIIGYKEIGMDHFALTTDTLYTSMENNTLHRNFMGYTASKTQAMIGLGVSSISDSWYGFAQNVKSLEEYYHLLNENIIPIYRGHILNTEDLKIRKHVLNLMCHFQTTWKDANQRFDELPEVLIKLKEFEKDGLLTFETNGLKVTDAGKPFIRNICMAFDLLLQRKQPDRQLFSMTV
ncbi:MAG: oxygen-independent coproporphyrinogen III oxidase [Winogradskyella sp.]|uniref:oxygen-independent coproporphyrinogen III oxidase n=1 Tax=Winogradskyella sp. TaxID=1883156 RepID=UPI0017C1198F|nr:oxygen-independent coproporphyrinogen III oxidase [Winogradskyella sp.]MBT8243782.1 oxygen-independent coproporphyrinogen III oxidase [Winogradskyella sp.]NNK22026.1 oxygen-independent coproporphyrinogen III oxidase [Winogradskyella sp.]